MAYKNLQLDENCNSPRARKVEKRGTTKKMRARIRAAIRNGIDALDSFDIGRQSRRYNGWAS